MPPPAVNCDRTPPPATLPPLPPLASAADLVALDEWIVEAAGIYQREVTLRANEHHCLAELRTKGVIQ